jgi:hypothetical protein
MGGRVKRGQKQRGNAMARAMKAGRKEEKIDINRSVDANRDFLLKNHGGVILTNDDGSYPSTPWRSARPAGQTPEQAKIERRRQRRLATWTGARA